jgi:septal ring factor EnvC (AmiA/AmiB activator)
VSPTHEEKDRSGLMTALVAGAIIALLAAVIYLFVQIDHLQTDLAKVQDKMMTAMTNEKDASTERLSSQQKRIEALKEDLEATRTQNTAQAKNLSAQAQKEATAHADALARQLAEEESKMKAQVAAQQSQIGDVQQAATAANAKIADVTTDVGGVKTHLTATDAELQKTIADLKTARGDLGVQSGLIATNGTELAALRLKGERNYVDIKLSKKDKNKRFADITLTLKNVDAKKNKYTVDVMADDKLTEKKDKGLNEPVQFYTAKGGRTPYEIVINQVGKDQIVGYLSTPKDLANR